MTKVEQLEQELVAWKERSKTKQHIINMLKVQNQTYRSLINLLSDTKNQN